jgi:hypothetical protein
MNRSHVEAVWDAEVKTAGFSKGNALLLFDPVTSASEEDPGRTGKAIRPGLDGAVDQPMRGKLTIRK